MDIKYSVIIPIKNEAENIGPLINEVEEVLLKMEKPWELIVINDGSTDSSLKQLKEMQISRPYLKVLTFDKNYGQSAAMLAGFEKAEGEIVISLDGDRQNDPKDIPNLLNKLSGFDLVCGWRKDRKDTLFKRLISKLANLIRGFLCEDSLHDSGCSLKVYRKKALSQLPAFYGMHRFLPALFVFKGYKVTECPVNHRPRTEGKSHYNIFNRSIGPMLDLLGMWWLMNRKIDYSIKEFSSNE